MNLRDRQAIGRKVAVLVLEAEQRHPEGSGAAKRAWVMKEAAKTVPHDGGASQAFGRWIGAALLRIAIEAAVCAMNATREHLRG